MADWLLRHLVSAPKRESLLGDLREQLTRGRSTAWYWRQALRAIFSSVTNEMLTNKAATVLVLALGVSLDRVYRLFLFPISFIIEQWWYPRLINSQWSWAVTNPWAYRLQLYSLTARTTYCVLVALVAALLVRLCSRNRVSVICVFMATQFALALPYLWTSWRLAIQHPANPMWFPNALWFSMFSLVAVPVSVMTGIRLVTPRQAISRL